MSWWSVSEELFFFFFYTVSLSLFVSCFVFRICSTGSRSENSKYKKHAIIGTVSGVGGVPLVELNMFLFPTERYILSCFHFSRWKDWCCKCEDFQVVYTAQETFPRLVLSEELWNSAFSFTCFVNKSDTQATCGLAWICLTSRIYT